MLNIMPIQLPKSLYTQDLRNDSAACPQDIDLSLRPERSIGLAQRLRLGDSNLKDFGDYVAVAFPEGNAALT